MTTPRVSAFEIRLSGKSMVNDINSEAASGRFYAPAPGRSYLLGASLSLRY